MLNLFLKAILAGVFISIGGIVNLKIGGPLGAFLFSFGLLSVVHYSLPLYTGKAGFCKYSEDVRVLPIILIGNILGTIIIGLPTHFIYPDISARASLLVDTRYTSDLLSALFKSMMCGLIMTTVVKFARQKKFIPLLIGIPLFILSGFWHSIADAFYYSVSLNIEITIVYIYIICVLGNYIGCNLYNLFVNKSLFCKEEKES
jgi:formate/nitrite transporter FocA (FNT family)